MLTALLSTLQSSLTSASSAIPKPFLLGSVLPIALFLAASYTTGLSLGGTVAEYTNKLNPLTSTASPTWNATFGGILVMTAAMLWSGINGLLLELLEGKHLGWLGRVLHAGERARLADLDGRIDRAQRTLRELERATRSSDRPRVDDSDSPPPKPYELMKSRLLDARRAGEAVGSRPPADPPLPPVIRLWKRLRGQPAAAPLADMRPLARVRWQARLGLVNKHAILEAAVEALSSELRLGMSDGVKRHQHELLIAIDETRERLKLEIQHLLKVRQFEFPSAFSARRGETAVRVLAPTRFGNVGLTIRSYAVDRYGMDLDIFWGRFQRVLPTHDKTYAALQDAKIQVDFVVSLLWLTALFTLLWTVVSGWIAPAPRSFLAVGIFGPLATRGLYLSALQNYMLFADQMKSAVDLHRFTLLKELHVAQPPGNREEQDHWRNLGSWIGYGNEVDVTYTEKP